MPLAPLYVDFKTRKAVAVKNVKVIEKVTTGTKIKIAKGSLAYVGMHLGMEQMALRYRASVPPTLIMTNSL